MTMLGTHPLPRRIIAWSLVVVLAAAIYSAIVAPALRTHQKIDEKRERIEELLAGFARIADAGTGIEDRLGSLKASQAGSGLYLDGKTQAQAGADLQERLTAMIRRNGGTVKSSETISSNMKDQPRRLTVRIQFTAYLRDVQKVLHGLESGRPALLIETLEIAIRTARKLSQGVTKKSMLSVSMNIVGHPRPELP